MVKMLQGAPSLARYLPLRWVALGPVLIAFREMYRAPLQPGCPYLITSSCSRDTPGRTLWNVIAPYNSAFGFQPRNLPRIISPKFEPDARPKSIPLGDKHSAKTFEGTSDRVSIGSRRNHRRSFRFHLSQTCERDPRSFCKLLLTYSYQRTG